MGYLGQAGLSPRLFSLKEIIHDCATPLRKEAIR
jgi:hypothetical protein